MPTETKASITAPPQASSQRRPGQVHRVVRNDLSRISPKNMMALRDAGVLTADGGEIES